VSVISCKTFYHHIDEYCNRRTNDCREYCDRCYIEKLEKENKELRKVVSLSERVADMDHLAMWYTHAQKVIEDHNT
jgi:hypothetical protein